MEFQKDIHPAKKRTELKEIPKGTSKGSLMLDLGISGLFKKRIQKCLEAFPTVRGPLNISPFLLDDTTLHEHTTHPDLPKLSDEDMCDFVSRYKQCEALVMCQWVHISSMLLRSISLTMGDSLVDLDVSGSHITATHMEILLSRMFHLQSMRMSDCLNIDSSCLKVLASTCSQTLTLLYIDHCPLLRHEALLYMSGCVGLGAPKLSHLRVLDMADCPRLEDRSLVALSMGCKQLRHLNLQNNSALGDAGVCAVVSSNPRLELLNLYGCVRISSAVLMEIGRHCPRLLSLNIALCILCTDQGVVSLAHGCKKLQAINLAGIRNISEMGLCALAENCNGLLMMNVTGCDKVAASGIRALVQGLHCVEEGQSYVGIKPKDKHIELKLINQLHMIHTSAATTIQKSVKASKMRQEVKAQFQYDLQNNAARVITIQIRRYGRRLIYYYMWRQRVSNASALFIQRVYRGHKGRVLANIQRQWWEGRRKLYPTATLIQRMTRGHLVRIKYPELYERIRLMYQRRRVESLNAVVIIIQRQVRRGLIYKRLLAFREYVYRGRLNKVHAATLIQQIMRSFLACKVVNHLRAKRREWEYVVDSAVRRIQTFLRDAVIRIRAAVAKEARRLRRELELKSVQLLQRVYRGFIGRQTYYRRRISEATRWFAAILIQKIFRGSQVLYWRDIRLNAIAAFVFDRQRYERSLRIQDCASRYDKFLIDNRHDSASEDDEENEPESSDWMEAVNKVNGQQYWYNALTHETTYVEPSSMRSIDMAYVGLRVRVLWLVQGDWYEGFIARFNAHKRKYRIEYDDGDHEWLNLDREGDRVQIWHDDTWVMKQLYMPVEKRVEHEKHMYRMQEKESKRIAMRDVKQWMVIQGDDSQVTTMYMSEISGELRTGVSDALNWEIRQDDMGYPMFMNSVTGAFSYEDPRFTYDISEDVKAQREFILQELRFTNYFCNNLLDVYNKATEDNDKRAISKALRAIRSSDKPKQLSALVSRAKALYKPASVLDRPMDAKVQSELTRAIEQTTIFAELTSDATFTGMSEAAAKRALREELSRKSKRQLFCWYCKHETQRHLEFCAICGKKQLF